MFLNLWHTSDKDWAIVLSQSGSFSEHEHTKWPQSAVEYLMIASINSPGSLKIVASRADSQWVAWLALIRVILASTIMIISCAFAAKQVGAEAVELKRHRKSEGEAGMEILYVEARSRIDVWRWQISDY